MKYKDTYTGEEVQKMHKTDLMKGMVLSGAMLFVGLIIGKVSSTLQ